MTLKTYFPKLNFIQNNTRNKISSAENNLAESVKYYRKLLTVHKHTNTLTIISNQNQKKKTKL